MNKTMTFFLSNEFIDYIVDEENMRQNIFTSNVEMVRRGQFGFDNGQAAYDLQVNCFGDLSFTEFAAQYLGHGQLAGDGPDVVIDPNINPEIFTQKIVRSGRRDYTSFPPRLDWSRRGNSLFSVLSN